MRIEKAYDSNGRIIKVGDRVVAKPQGCVAFEGTITQMVCDTDADITDVWVADDADSGAIVSECRVTRVGR